jgi:hypothetical protein
MHPFRHRDCCIFGFEPSNLLIFQHSNILALYHPASRICIVQYVTADACGWALVRGWMLAWRVDVGLCDASPLMPAVGRWCEGGCWHGEWMLACAMRHR